MLNFFVCSESQHKIRFGYRNLEKFFRLGKWETMNRNFVNSEEMEKFKKPFLESLKSIQAHWSKIKNSAHLFGFFAVKFVLETVLLFDI